MSSRDCIDDQDRDVIQDRADHGKKALKEREPEPETKTLTHDGPGVGFVHK